MKMNRKIRFLSLILAIVMVFSVIPFTAFASDTATTGVTVGEGSSEGNIEQAVTAPTDDATSVTDAATLIAALENGGNIVFANDITTTTAIVTSGITATVDLNGKTWNVRAGDNKFNDETNLTVKNGTVNIDGVVVKGNALFCLDEYEETLVTTVTLNDVDLVGKDYSSAYGIFYIGASSVLNVNGGEWTLENDLFAAGGVFKADQPTANLSINGTTITAHNVRRFVTYAATTVNNSTITITGDADGVDVEMEHGFNRSPLTITNSTITMTDLVGRGITAECGVVNISDNSTVTITNAQEATIDVRNGQTVTVDGTSAVTVDAEPTITSGTITGTVTVNVPPKGTNSAYISMGNGSSYFTQIWGEIGSNANNSLVINLYSGETLLAVATYNQGGLTGETKWTGWYIPLNQSGTNGDWDIAWKQVVTADYQPTHVDLYVDGVKVNTAVVQFTSPDNLYPIYAAVVDADGKFVGYATSVTAAIEQADAVSGSVVLVRDTNETISIPEGVNVTLDLGGKTLNGSILAPNANLTVKNGSIVNTNANVSALEINAGTLTLTDVNMDSARHALRIDGAVEATVNGGTYRSGTGTGTGTYHAVNVSGAANVTIIDGVFVGPKGTTADSGAAVNVQAGATVTINGGNFSNGLNNTLDADGTLTVYGGTFDQKPTAYVAENYAVVDNGDGTYGVSGYVAAIGNVKYVSLAEAFAAAQAGDEVVILVAGTYSLSGISGKNITVTATVDDVVFDNIGKMNMGGANVTFNNVTFDYYPNGTYTGLQHSGNLVYNNCTINGQVFLYGVSETFNNCTFNQNSADAYNVWTYGAKVVKFNECTFNCVGKAVLVYAEGTNMTTDLTVEKTTFNASAPAAGKAAIEIDTSLTAGATITVDGDTTATGFDTGSVSGNTLWNNKKGSEGVNNDITVTVNDETVLEPTYSAAIGNVKYETLAEAFAAAKPGDTIVLLSDITLTEQIKITDNALLANITLDGNGKTITANLNKENQSVLYFGDPNTGAWATGVTITDLTIDATARFGIALMGGTTSILTNVNVSGDYVYGINLYGTHGATMTNCEIVTMFTNAQDAYPLILNNTTVGELWANKSDVVEEKGKVYINDGSTVDTLYVWGGNTSMIEFGIENVKEVVTTDGTEMVAKVGDVYYSTLAAAVAAAPAGATVTLLKSASGAGIVVDKDITIDFGGNTYTLTSGVGSANTKTNGLQLLAGNTVTLKNGILNVAEANKADFYILVQNYANLTVTDMLLDGTNLDKYSTTDGDSYTLSNNSGTVVINGNTDIIANDEGDLAFAFDVCKYGSYDAPVVTINTTGTISGNFEVSESIQANLVIKSGNFTVNPSAYVADGSYASANDGMYGVVVGTFDGEAYFNGVGYATLMDAVKAANQYIVDNAAGSVPTIVLNKDVTVDSTIYLGGYAANGIFLDGNNHKITSDADVAIMHAGGAGKIVNVIIECAKTAIKASSTADVETIKAYLSNNFVANPTRSWDQITRNNFIGNDKREVVLVNVQIAGAETGIIVGAGRNTRLQLVGGTAIDAAAKLVIEDGAYVMLASYHNGKFDGSAYADMGKVSVGAGATLTVASSDQAVLSGNTYIAAGQGATISGITLDTTAAVAVEWTLGADVATDGGLNNVTINAANTAISIVGAGENVAINIVNSTVTAGKLVNFNVDGTVTVALGDTTMTADGTNVAAIEIYGGLLTVSQYAGSTAAGTVTVTGQNVVYVDYASYDGYVEAGLIDFGTQNGFFEQACVTVEYEEGKYVKYMTGAASFNGVGYMTLEEAVKAANEYLIANGSLVPVITLYGDVTIENTLYLGGYNKNTPILNGNGHTITYNGIGVAIVYAGDIGTFENVNIVCPNGTAFATTYDSAALIAYLDTNYDKSTNPNGWDWAKIVSSNFICNTNKNITLRDVAISAKTGIVLGGTGKSTRFAPFGTTKIVATANAIEIGEGEYVTLASYDNGSFNNNAYTDLGKVVLGAGATLTRAGNDSIVFSGNTYIVAENGATIDRISFKNITNGVNLSAIYAHNDVTVTNCTFDTVDWDAIQITTGETYTGTLTAVITNNTFKGTMKRAIHIEGYGNVGETYVLTVTGNTIDATEMTDAICIWYVNLGEDSDLTKNNVSDPDKVVTLLGKYGGDRSDNTVAPEIFLPFVDAQGNEITYGAYVSAADYNTGAYYATFADAYEAAVDGETIILLADVALDNELQIKKNITLDGNGKKISSTANVVMWLMADVTVKNVTVNATKFGICVYSGVSTANIENVTVNAIYAVYTHSKAEGSVVYVTESTLNGWAALYLNAKGEVNVIDSKLVGTNNMSDVPENVFGTIAVQGEGVVLNVNGGSISTSGTARAYTVCVDYDGLKGATVNVADDVTVTTQVINDPVVFYNNGVEIKASASLKYHDDDLAMSDSSIRFGYNIVLPEGLTIDNIKAIRWNYGASADKLAGEWAADDWVENTDGSVTANAVFDLSAHNYAYALYVQLVVEYTDANGNKCTYVDNVRAMSIWELATWYAKNYTETAFKAWFIESYGVTDDEVIHDEWVKFHNYVFVISQMYADYDGYVTWSIYFKHITYEDGSCELKFQDDVYHYNYEGELIVSIGYNSATASAA